MRTPLGFLLVVALLVIPDEIPDAAAAYPSDMPLEQVGRVRASVRVFYALR